MRREAEGTGCAQPAEDSEGSRCGLLLAKRAEKGDPDS